MSDQPQPAAPPPAPAAPPPAPTAWGTGAPAPIPTSTDPDQTSNPDDNAELDLGGDEPQGAAQVAPASNDDVGTIIAEEDREIPPTIDPSITDVPLAAHIYVRAHHNLPGWNLWAEEIPEVVERGVVVQAAHHSDGWIPNNEEGVHAVELGFAELIEAPEGEESPPAPANRNPYVGL